MRIPTKPWVAFGLPYLHVDWVIWHWYAWVANGRSLGRAGGRSVYGHVITKFSRMGRLLHFLTHGAPLARFARQSSTITASQMAKQMVTLRIKMHRSRVSDGFDHFTRVCPASFPYFWSMNSLRNLFAALPKQFGTFFWFCFALFCFVFFQFLSLFVLLLFSYFFFPLRDVHACKISFFCWRLLACWWNTSAVTMKIKSLKSYFGIMHPLISFRFLVKLTLAWELKFNCQISFVEVGFLYGERLHMQDQVYSL